MLRAERTRIRLLIVGAAGYAGLIALVTWQALRGRSIVHPDVRTLAAATALVVGVTISSVLVLRRSDPSGRLGRNGL